MTPQEALNILDEIAQDYPLKFRAQATVRKAVAVLQDLISPQQLEVAEPSLETVEAS